MHSQNPSLRRLRLAGMTAALVLFAMAPAVVYAQSASKLVANAKLAVESGEVDPERHLKPIIDRLAKTSSERDADALIRAIDSLGRANGSSPLAVKRYLLEHAPPALLTAAKADLPWSTRGSALMALRSLDAPDEVMREAIAIGRADERNYVKSRADLLQRWMDERGSRPVSTENIVAVDPAKEREALAFLRSQRVGVSVDSLRNAAGRGETDVVGALLDAGVDVKARDMVGMDAVAGVLVLGCNNRVDEDALAETLRLLAARGADLEGRDPRGNTNMMRATQSCGLAVVRALLDLGVETNPVNAQQFTPLAMAIASAKIDVAELLVERGARLTPEAADRLFIEPPRDERVQRLLKNALGG